MNAINYQIIEEEYVIEINGEREPVSENIYELVKALDSQTGMDDTFLRDLIYE